MKKKFIAVFAVIALFMMVIAAYAYTQQTTTLGDKACCCKGEGDSCPMKGKSHDEKGEHAGMSCCKKHDGEHAEHAKGEGHSCDCCGDSCPMKKGEGAAVSVSTSTDGKSCCDCCGDSCPMKKEKPKTTA